MAKEKSKGKDKNSLNSTSKNNNNNNNNEKNNETKAVLSSGPIEASPYTVLVSVNILNIDPEEAREVIIEIKNWTNCPPEELGKYVFLCGEEIDPCNIDHCEEENKNGTFDPTLPPSEIEEEEFPPITTPLFFQLPAQMQLTVLAEFPQEPILQSNPCYEVRIYLKNPENILVSSNGLNEEYIPQLGNTVLDHQFFSFPPNKLKFPKKTK